MRSAAALAGIDPLFYRRHSLHSSDRIWVEKNCYVDIWIELLHALELDPMAMLPFTVAVDFEDDQWTFFKPPHEDLKALYGIGVEELYVWRPLLDHALEHLAARRFISTEADAFWLPDTAGSDYREKHTKTTIVLAAVDVEARRLDYFHNAGYHLLEGEDFDRTFRRGEAPDPTFMPMFAELVRYDRVVRRSPDDLREASAALLCRHVAWMPSDNPVDRFARRLEADWPTMAQAGLAHYHAWVFGTLRQLGAAAELSASYLQWLEPGNAHLEAAAQAFTQISTIAKSLILKTVRAVNAKRPLDASAGLCGMATAWELASSALRSRA